MSDLVCALYSLRIYAKKPIISVRDRPKLILKFSNFEINKSQKRNLLFGRFSCLVEKSPNGEKQCCLWN